MGLTPCEAPKREKGQTTTTICDKCVGCLTSPANWVTLRMQETVPTVIVLNLNERVLRITQAQRGTSIWKCQECSSEKFDLNPWGRQSAESESGFVVPPKIKFVTLYESAVFLFFSSASLKDILTAKHDGNVSSENTLGETKICELHS